MFHIAAYNLLIGNVANTDVPAVVDGVLSISNNHFRLVDNMNLVGAYYGSLTAIRARLDSPTMRLPGNPYILPVNTALLPVDRHKVLDLRKYPYALPQREEVALQGTSNPGTTEQAYGLIWLSMGGVGGMPPGRVQWVRGTSSTAAVANTWTTLTYTLDSALPTGYWAMIGSEHQSATAIAHRIFFPGQIYRPGFLSRTSEGNMSYWWNYDGSLGEMGRFVNDNQFQLQVLCNGADAAHVAYFGLVQVGSM